MSTVLELRDLVLSEAAPRRPGSAWMGSRAPTAAPRPGWKKPRTGGWASAEDPDPKDAVDPDAVRWSGPGFHPERSPPDSPERQTKFASVRAIVRRDDRGYPVFGTVQVDRDVFAAWKAEHPLDPFEVVPPRPGGAVVGNPWAAPAKTAGPSFRLMDQCPAVTNFVIKFSGRAWPGGVIAMMVVKHAQYSDADVLQWLRELAEKQRPRGGLNAQAKAYVSAREISIPFREFSSSGIFGPAIANYGCREITSGFDEVAAFAKMVEKDRASAMALMKELRGTLVKFGEIRWQLLRHLG